MRTSSDLVVGDRALQLVDLAVSNSASRGRRRHLEGFTTGSEELDRLVVGVVAQHEVDGSSELVRDGGGCDACVGLGALHVVKAPDLGLESDGEVGGLVERPAEIGLPLRRLPLSPSSCRCSGARS